MIAIEGPFMDEAGRGHQRWWRRRGRALINRAIIVTSKASEREGEAIHIWDGSKRL